MRRRKRKPINIYEKHHIYVNKAHLCHQHYSGYKYGNNKFHNIKSFYYYMLWRYYDKKEMDSFMKLPSRKDIDMTKQDFIQIVKQIQKNKQDLCVAVTIPGQSDIEYIVNKYDSIENKLAYYIKTYDDNLCHCMNDKIKITKVFGIDFYIG